MPVDDAAPVKLGWRSALGLGQQAEYDVAAAIDRFLEFNSEGIAAQKQRIESQALRRSEFQGGWGAGSEGVEGDVTVELAGVAQTILWRNALGAVASAQPDGAVDAWEHVFTPGDLSQLWLTAQVARDDVPFTYVGCKVGQLQLSCEVNQIASLQVSLVGRQELLGVAAAEPAYPDPYPLLTFVHGRLVFDGDEVAVNSVSASLNNGLATDRRRLGSGLRRNPERTAFRDFTGSFNADFSDLGLYNYFVNGVEATLELDFTSDLAIEQVETDPGPPPVLTPIPYAVRLRTNVRVDGNTPTVDGAAEIRQTLAWKAFPSAAVPDTVEVTVVTDSAAP